MIKIIAAALIGFSLLWSAAPVYAQEKCFTIEEVTEIAASRGLTDTVVVTGGTAQAIRAYINNAAKDLGVSDELFPDVEAFLVIPLPQMNMVHMVAFAKGCGVSETQVPIDVFIRAKQNTQASD